MTVLTGWLENLPCRMHSSLWKAFADVLSVQPVHRAPSLHKVHTALSASHTTMNPKNEQVRTLDRDQHVIAENCM